MKSIVDESLTAVFQFVQRTATRPIILQPVNTSGSPNMEQKCSGVSGGATLGVDSKNGGHTTIPSTGCKQAPRRSSSHSLDAEHNGIKPISSRLQHSGFFDCCHVLRTNATCDGGNISPSFCSKSWIFCHIWDCLPVVQYLKC
jgi:hypothetical protein